MDQYKFPCEPVANPESTIVGPQYRFTVLDDRVLRYEWAADGVFEDRASTFAINRKFPKPEFQVVDKEVQLDIITPTYHLTYDKKRFSPNGLFVGFTSKQLKWGSEWRYGDVPDRFNFGGTARTLDEVDGRCDMGMGIISRSGYASLDDSTSMLFDGQGFVITRKEGDRVDGYLFCYGYDYKSAMRSFYAISGPQPAVPRWCLGNWWSRYHAYTQDEYLGLMDKFKDNQIPLSVAVIDMDWHLVSGDEVPHAGWTGYTWNKKLFPDHVAFAKELHDRKLKTTLNDHPRDGVHAHEEAYEEMAKAVGHDTTNRTPILFDPTSPKFMHAFLNVLHRRLENEGCDFWWIDWQQGSYSRIPGFDPLWLLNHFHYLDQQHVRDPTEALIFSRYAGPGSHRYPVGFSGDTVTSWASLQFQPEFTATASNIGYGWWSHDIGGHLRGTRNDELNVRWVQSGVFSPLMRLHSTHSPWMSKEPWLYRKESEEVIRSIMQFRHRLVPYIYSASLTGSQPILPLVQPLYWNHAEYTSSYKFPTEYYFGPSMLVAPILTPRNNDTNLATIRAWIPPSRHVDIFTGTVYDGAQEVDLYRPLDGVPVLAPEGSVIPLDGDAVPENGCPNPDSIEVIIIVGKDGRFELIEEARDDKSKDANATTKRRSIDIEYWQSDGRLVTSASGRSWTFRFLSARIDPTQVWVYIDNAPAKSSEFTVEASKPGAMLETIVRVPANVGQNFITVELGRSARLEVLDHTQTVKDMLRQFQIEFQTKDRIWEIFEGAASPTSAVSSTAVAPLQQQVSTKMARLLSLGLPEHVLGPIAELLLADSRSSGAA